LIYPNFPPNARSCGPPLNPPVNGKQGGGRRRSFVTNNLDTLLTALYVDLDDRVLPALGWVA